MSDSTSAFRHRALWLSLNLLKTPEHNSKNSLSASVELSLTPQAKVWMKLKYCASKDALWGQGSPLTSRASKDTNPLMEKPSMMSSSADVHSFIFLRGGLGRDEEGFL